MADDFKIVEQYIKNATVKIIIDDTLYGTGFFISPDGFILTAYHCIAGAETIYIETPFDGRLLAELHKDKSLSANLYDLAVLKVNYSPSHFLPLGSVSESYISDEVVAIGYPASNLAHNERVGIYKGHLSRWRDDNRLELSNSIKGKGQSGGAVYHYRSQRVVAVVVERYHQVAMIDAGLATRLDALFQKWPTLTDLNHVNCSQWDKQLSNKKSPEEFASETRMHNIETLCRKIFDLSETQRKILFIIATERGVKFNSLRRSFPHIPSREFSYRIKELMALNLVNIATEIATDGPGVTLSSRQQGISVNDYDLLLRLFKHRTLYDTPEDIISLYNLLSPKSFDNNLFKKLGLESLITCEIFWIRNSIAAKISLPKEIQAQLSNDSSNDVRNTIAGRLDLPGEILEQLSRDSSNDVRNTIAGRLDLPGEILEQLSRDSSNDVRNTVAGRLDLPGEILEQLSRDSYNDVRNTIAGRLDLPGEILEQLSRDSSNDVRNTIAGRLDLPEKILEQLSHDSSNNVRNTIVVRANLPEKILEIFLHDEESYIRARLANRPDLSERILELLADDPSDFVKIYTLGHANCPEQILKKYASHEKARLRQVISKRPDLSIEVKNILAENKKIMLEKHLFVNGICTRCGCKPEFVEYFETDCTSPS
jgi:ribosomal protein S17E